ncbi:OprO/OprP family phosphate-selective porin [Candidatus Latescibacterota bacterium]
MNRIRKMSFALVSVFLLFTSFSQAQELSNIKVGGRMMNDWAWMSPDDDVKTTVGDFTDGSEFRRLWLYTSGSINDYMDFIIQLDLTSGAVKFRDVYVALTGLPVTVKVGHIKEPFGLEISTSSKYITFMERGLPSLFSPGWNNGIQFSSSAYNKRLNWVAGVFANTGGNGYSDTEEGYNLTARVTGTPLFADDGAKLLHLGLSVTNRNTTDNTAYAQGPEMGLAPDMIDTKAFSCDKIMIYNGESALIHGPFSVQGELFLSNVSSGALNDPSFFGYYGQASYFITGEHREYKSGVFSNVKPLKSYGSGGIGAVELAARYSYLDLDSGTLKGGTLSNMSVGVNWHFNSYSRVMVNIVRSELKDVGFVNILGTRMQFFF